MQWFYNLKVSVKLLLGFALVALIAAFIGYEGVTSLKTADESDTTLFERNTKPLAKVGEIVDAFQRQRVNVLELIHAVNESEHKTNLEKIMARRSEIDKYVPELKSMITAKEVLDKIQVFHDLDNQFD